MKLISLTHDRVATVDDCDYDLVAALGPWSATRANTKRELWYATHGGLRMHRVIAGASDGTLVDHVDGDGLNNIRKNLRVCSRQQNRANAGPLSTNTSGFKGVTKHKLTGKWQAAIKHNGRCIHLGLHDTAYAAHLAYANKNTELNGEFARNHRFLPCFNLGGRPTKVVPAGGEYAAIFEDTEEVIDHCTWVDLEDAVRVARREATPPPERDEGDCSRCSGHGCNDCLDVNATAF